MALLALVLLASLLFEDDDLIALAVANDRGLYGAGTDARAREQRLDLHRLSCVGTDRRHAERLTALNGKLLATRSDNCVTHF